MSIEHVNALQRGDQLLVCFAMPRAEALINALQSNITVLLVTVPTPVPNAGDSVRNGPFDELVDG